QVLFFDLFRRGGGTALVAFKVLVVAALFPAAAWLGWRRSGSWLLSAGPAIAAAFVCRPFLDIRPQLFSFVGALAVVAIVDAYRRAPPPSARSSSPRPCWRSRSFSRPLGGSISPTPRTSP